MANIIDGTEFNDLLDGTPEDDIISGFAGSDTLNGWEGNDTLYGGEGFDFLNGGDGDDLIDPGSGNGVITGSTGSDTIDYSGVQFGFANLLYRELEDGIVASIDVDGDFAEVTKNSGTDEILGMRSLFEKTDGIYLEGTSYDDVFILEHNDLTSSQLILAPGDGMDSYYIGGDYEGQSSNVRLGFTFGADGSIVEQGVHIDLGLESGQIIDDGFGNSETISGPGYIRQFFLTVGDDIFIGGDGDERIRTYSGNDFIDGGGGIDRLDMGTNEFQSLVVDLTAGTATGQYFSFLTGFQPLTYTLANIEDVFGSRNDADHITGSDVGNSLHGRGGDDTLIGLGGEDSLRGDDGNDVLIGGDGVDTLTGGDDNDHLDGGADGDILEGGAGRDTASYASASTGVVANLLDSAMNSGDAAGDSYVSIEDVEGSAFSDILSGDGNANGITGGDGDDVLTGGDGADQFIFDVMDGIDTILDFEVGIEHIVITTAGVGFGDLEIVETIEAGGGHIPAENLPQSVVERLAERFQKVATVSFGQTEISVLLDGDATLGIDDFLFA